MGRVSCGGGLALGLLRRQRVTELGACAQGRPGLSAFSPACFRGRWAPREPVAALACPCIGGSLRVPSLWRPQGSVMGGRQGGEGLADIL